MYMDIYPDCCSYYPTQTSGYKTSFSDKYISGFCGFVEFTVHRRYVGASGTIEDALPYGLIWAVDYKYNIIEHPKRR
ncbi:hypothetical protein C8N35_101696 [Breoghania corrubedonensis]|uniref:Uncharacterized protein n=2 Tax=Breoghania corrubedonensis TaxID=665038 RepID=A0A2T5VFX3_9HYPH|nr:hypothetical protein C8N35_101696 [Breoghania corrubedonensis]